MANGLRANGVTTEKRSISFDVTDSRGRVIGCEVVCTEYDYVDPGDAKFYYVNVELGHWFHAEVQATRNGKSYGAGQGGASFKTPEERDAYVAKRIEASRKAAIKKSKEAVR